MKSKLIDCPTCNKKIPSTADMCGFCGKIIVSPFGTFVAVVFIFFIIPIIILTGYRILVFSNIYATVVFFIFFIQIILPTIILAGSYIWFSLTYPALLPQYHYDFRKGEKK